jgi:Flp pilus assembly protein TadG
VAPTPVEHPEPTVPPAVSGRRSRMGALRATSGQTLPLVVVFMFTILIFAGLVIDLGNAYRVQQALQASTDASAAAGAGQLTTTFPPVGANAIAAAKKYGSQSGGTNPITGVPAANVSQTVTATCVVQGTFTCTYPNTVTVDETANVPTYLLNLLGFSTIQLKAHAQACSPCGEVPLDIMLVLDRTGSMASDNKLANLKTGLLQGFLPGLDPTADYVGLAVLPPDMNGTSDICNAEPGEAYPADATYGHTPYSVNNPTYLMVPLSNNYATAAGTLIPGSPLVSDINCMKAGGQTGYASAMEAADAELIKDGRTGVQKVMVVLSDGAANEGQSCLDTTTKVKGKTVITPDPDPHCMQPCQTAVNDATTYKASAGSAKVLVYTILYGDQTNGANCQTYQQNDEVPAITSLTAMQEMASPGNYYPDPDPTNLKTIFQQIASDLAAGTSRIVQ